MPAQRPCPETPRRHFLIQAGGCAAAAALGIPAFSALASDTAPAAIPAPHPGWLLAFSGAGARGPKVPDMPARQLSRHVWGIIARDALPSGENLGFFSSCFFVLTKKGVVVFDTGSSVQVGEMFIRQIRQVSRAPVVAVVNSHWHGDHWMGNQAFYQAFGAKLPVYALAGCTAGIQGAMGQAWVRNMFSWTQGAINGTEPMLPNREISHGQVLDFGDVKLRAHHYAVAHTPFDLCMEVVGDGVTLIGDLAGNRRISNMDDGSFEGSLAYFSQIERNTRTRLWCSAHGEPSADQLQWNQTLFTGIWDSALAAAKEGAGPEAAKAMALTHPKVIEAMPGTIGFNANIGKFCSIAYLEAEKKLF